MERSQQNDARKVLALKVRQWLPEWESVEYDEDSHRRKPEPHFYLFTLPAAELKALTGIRRRTTEGGLLRSQDLGNQRRHDPARSEEIGQFVRYGYPWSDLDQVKRESGRFDDLRKPGWLPTAIVLNIRTPDDERGNREVAAPDLITVHEGDGVEAQALVTDLPGSAWARLSAGDGSQGPRWYDWALLALPYDAPPGMAHWLLARRSVSDPSEHAYYRVCGPAETPMPAIVRVAGRRWCIESAFEEAKGLVGLDEYEGRKWDAWHRHITLCQLAYAALVVTRARAAREEEKGAERC